MNLEEMNVSSLFSCTFVPFRGGDMQENGSVSFFAILFELWKLIFIVLKYVIAQKEIVYSSLFTEEEKNKTKLNNKIQQLLFWSFFFSIGNAYLVVYSQNLAIIK